MILETGTVENLEFDGNTVLCRVCGDKASGFHYGVHACEGCKGFFRRSIQQKIQYRPCLKNQQCNIMRVNRNRCQYCRLKKCISVGMSRDAVRFGRVPKKEKAKIMEQMKRVNAQSQLMSLDSSLESDPEFLSKIVKAHFQNCDFTREKLRDMCEKAWAHPDFITCPAHMACPLNPRPVDKDEAGDQDKWQEFSEFFTPAIRNVVNFAKNLPGFQLFSQEDQVTLLKAGTFEVLLVHLAPLFDTQRGTMMFANGKLYKRDHFPVATNAGFLLDSMFDFSDRLNQMSLNDEEIALFSAAVIIASDRPGLRNAEIVEKVQSKIHKGLQTMLGINHPDDHSLFPKLLMKIPDLRTLNTLHSEKLLGTTVPEGTSLVKTEANEEEPRHGISLEESRSRDQNKDDKMATCPFPRNGGLLSGNVPPFSGMLPFGPHLTTPASMLPASAYPDLRQNMLEAYNVYGRLPPPHLPPGWPGVKQENPSDIPPFWAQLASANQSVCPMGDNKVHHNEISGSDDMYGERRGSNASSVRSYASSSSFHLRDDDPMLNSYSSKRSKAPHTISKSPSLDAKNGGDDDHDMPLDSSNDARKSDSQTDAKDRSRGSPDPIELDLPSRDIPSRDLLPRDRIRKHSLSLSPLPFAPRGRSVSDVTYTADALADVRRKRLLPSDRMDMEPKMPRLHALWEYDMRASRSNSISSSSSLESADSAYRTISNPGTPRSGLGDARSPYDPRMAAGFEARSPYALPRDAGALIRSVADTKQSFSPYRGSPLLSGQTGSLIPSPLAMDRERSHNAADERHGDGSEVRKSLDGSEGGKTSSSPVLKTALSMPPLIGQEAWFHTPKRNPFALPVSTAVARSMSQDTTMSEDIDVESIETDIAAHAQGTPAHSQEEQPNKVFKLKKSFLDRFSPEPPTNENDAKSAVEKLKRSTASPAGSLPERSTEYPLEVPKRSKTASPQYFEDSRLSPSSMRESLNNRGRQFSERFSKDINAKERALKNNQSSESDSSRVQASSLTSVPALPTSIPTPSLMSAALGSQVMHPFMANYANPAFMYQYAALHQQFQNIQAFQQQLQRSTEQKGQALDLVVKKESPQ